MDNSEKKPEKVKPERTVPALKQPKWPGQGNHGGIRNAKSVHDRKPSGRGSSRGR
jgi:hypothetical protein